MNNENPIMLAVKEVAIKAYDAFWGVDKPPTEQEILLSQIYEVQKRLASAKSLFNSTTEPHLIDFVSYDILAEEARYSYLIKCAKEKGIRF